MPYETKKKKKKINKRQQINEEYNEDNKQQNGEYNKDKAPKKKKKREEEDNLEYTLLCCEDAKKEIRMKRQKGNQVTGNGKVRGVGEYNKGENICLIYYPCQLFSLVFLPNWETKLCGPGGIIFHIIFFLSCFPS